MLKNFFPLMWIASKAKTIQTTSHAFCVLYGSLRERFFSIAWQSSELPFSGLSFANLRISLLLFLIPLAFCGAYFLRTQLCKYRNPLLLFHRLIFSTSELTFSHQTLNHSTQFQLFQQQISFPLHAFAEGI